MKKNLAIQVVDRLFLVAYGTTGPTDEEWSSYLALVERHGDQTQQLISTQGGAPTSAQRRQLAVLLGGRTVPVAILSSSARVRAMTVALSWFNARIKVFAPSALSDALDFLGVPASREALITVELKKLRAELDEEESAAAPRATPPLEYVVETVEIDYAMLGRLDALAARCGVPRDKILDRCIKSGLEEIEAAAENSKPPGASR
jgi:hypothetical protein